MKTYALLAMLLASAACINQAPKAHKEDSITWNPIDVKNLNEDQQSVDDAIRDKFDAL